ncbi:FHA domain-containing protein [Chamaesiphon sp. VAR_48_metabat_403]|uniref:FHA domain-containing protein n=1 Tax=Chamaesiphon sp. VAR_48_metabat_403 TaxID=2964700 RepID=UPI00286E0DC9|nr:FHA domain-containing protein [Chamaesiphon sp. VAR_48_metabat_403]
MKVKIYYAEVAPELEAPEFDLNSLKVRGDCTIGRSPECGLVLDGADLSRQHAKFSTKDGSYYFTDLGSRNGSLFNGELVDGGREYPMNAGDTIRIGDFILKVEEEPELAATVFKVIDPALFKVSQQQVEIPTNPAAAAIAPLIVSGIIINDPSEIAPPDLSSQQPPSLGLVEDNIDISTQPDPVVAETPPAPAIEDESSVATPLNLTAQPPSLASLDDLLDGTDPLDGILAETPPTAVTSDDWGVESLPDSLETPPSLASLDDDLDSTDPLAPILAQTPLTEVISDDWGAENSLDLALETPPSPASIDEELDAVEPIDRGLEEHSDLSIDREEPDVAQPSLSLVNEELAEPETVPPATIVESGEGEDLADLDLLAQPEIALEVDRTDDENMLDRVPQAYSLPPLTNDVWNVGEDPPVVPVEPVISEVDNDDLSLVDLTDLPLALDLNASDEEPISPPSVVASAPDLASELASDADLAPELDSPIPPSVELVVDELVVVETPAFGLENSELTTDELAGETPDLGLESLDLTADELEDMDTFEQRQTAEVESEASAELELEIPLTVDTMAPIAAAVTTAAVIGGFNAYNHGNGAELLSKKQIVLIAHDSKIADLTDIVERHKDFLAKCLTISWSSIADDVRQQTGLEINQQISSGASGGYQTIASLVNAGDILAVIFLKDFFAPPQAGQANEEALLRLCNINEILLATNMATADSIVHYLQS